MSHNYRDHHTRLRGLFQWETGQVAVLTDGDDLPVINETYVAWLEDRAAPGGVVVEQPGKAKSPTE